MAHAATPAFCQWLRMTLNMKLGTNMVVNQVLAEGIYDYNSLLDFDKSSLESLPKACQHKVPAVAADVANGIRKVYANRDNNK